MEGDYKVHFEETPDLGMAADIQWLFFLFSLIKTFFFSVIYKDCQSVGNSKILKVKYDTITKARNLYTDTNRPISQTDPCLYGSILSLDTYST